MASAAFVTEAARDAALPRHFAEVTTFYTYPEQTHFRVSPFNQGKPVLRRFPPSSGFLLASVAG
jgi:hypothetical protein